MLATYAAIGLENARLYESELNRRENAEILRETTNKLTLAVELDELFEVILESLKKLIPYDSASIELIHQDYCEITAGHGIPENLIGKRYQVDISKWGIKEITRQPVILYDVQADDRFTKFEGTEYIRSWLGIPLLTQGKLIRIFKSRQPHPWFLHGRACLSGANIWQSGCHCDRKSPLISGTESPFPDHRDPGKHCKRDSHHTRGYSSA